LTDYQPANNSASASVWVNYPPTITSIPTQNMLEDGAPLTVGFSVQDVETPAGSLTLWVSSSNPALAPTNNLILAGAGTARTLTMTPLPNQFGTATITVFVADSQNTVSTNFQLLVNAVNDAPVLSPIADRTVDEGTQLVVTAAASDVESPPQTLTFALVASPAGATVDAVTGRVTWTPSESQGPSTNTFTLRVFDNGAPSLSATQSFSVVVRELNSAPVLGAVPDQTVIETAALNWQATANDSDIPTNTLTFGLVSGPTGLTVSASGAIAWTPTAGFLPSTNTVTLRVFDNGSPSLSSTGSFRVIVNHRPVAASPAIQRTVSVAVKVTIAELLGSDPDGDVISLASVPASSVQGIPIRQDGVWVYYTPAGSVTAADSFTYAIRDARGATNMGTVALSVKADTNTTPSLSVRDLGNGSYHVRLGGIPGYTYRVEATASLVTPSWQAIGTTAADDSGLVNFVDAPPGGTLRYYRLAPPGAP
jgi:hypothetical protein